MTMHAHFENAALEVTNEDQLLGIVWAGKEALREVVENVKKAAGMSNNYQLMETAMMISEARYVMSELFIVDYIIQKKTPFQTAVHFGTEMDNLIKMLSDHGLVKVYSLEEVKERIEKGKKL